MPGHQPLFMSISPAFMQKILFKMLASQFGFILRHLVTKEVLTIIYCLYDDKGKLFIA